MRKRAADIAPIVKELRASGAVTLQAIADGLNERGIPVARGGQWRITQVVRLLETIDNPFSLVVKRSMVIAGRKTSISIEDVFWNGLRGIAKGRKETVSQLLASIDANRKAANLSSAIRVFVNDFYRDQFKREEMVSQAVDDSKSTPAS
jgi:predicted DNA-binding ribbon-helix-helix protein